MKESIILIFSVFCLSFLASSAFAYDCQNNSDDENLPITTELSRELGFNKIHMAACKALPNNKDESIFVLINATDQTNSIDESCDNICSFDLNVLRVTKNGKIIERFYKEAAFSKDAMRFENLIIDTGRYQLSRNQRAFGFRLSFYGSSRVSPLNMEILYLFRSHNAQLIPVFQAMASSLNTPPFVGLIVGSYQGDWDTRCVGHFAESKTTIDMDQNGTDMNDLILKTETEYTTSEPQDQQECTEMSVGHSTTITTLKFDKTGFPIPDSLSKQ